MPAPQNTAVTPMPTTQRFTWMDTMRGLAIVLVILRHGSTTLIEYQIFPTIWFQALQDVLVPFRMPALMLLSGLLLDRALKKNLGQYTLGKMQNLLWPYVIWAAIFLGVSNGGEQYLEPMAWVSTSYLWFIFFLMIYFAIAPFIKFLPAWVPVLAAWIGSWFEPYAASLLGQLLYFAGWFFLGQLASRHWDLVNRLLRPTPAIIAAVLAAFGAYFSLTYPARIEYRVEIVPFAIAGIIAAITLVRAIPDARTGWIRFIGRTSLVWYVAHIPIMLVTRRILVMAGVENFWIHYIAGCTMAFLGSWVLARLFQRGAPFSWLFKAPWPKPKARTTA
ncbi:acyltransferase [Kocuria coralli]|uniref:Acyltransferase n=1 Tax=Kocuria coralli TaxID=1461025 RepID=A0A5J5L0Z2_9MICC|nr:acyltransferase family protein [Kocuria coralli]KAA9394865.1 acyltransferase [Kocuria coralli]